MTDQGNAARSCGHDPAQFVTADEGTSYCPACESDATPAAFCREMLAEFHAAVSHPDTDLLWLRRTLHDEEHAELVEALGEGDLEHIARELADVVYVAYGTAHAYGIDLDAALREVHRANMQKANGPRRADGKAMKPAGFVPPDMAEAVRDAA